MVSFSFDIKTFPAIFVVLTSYRLTKLRLAHSIETTPKCKISINISLDSFVEITEYTKKKYLTN